MESFKKITDRANGRPERPDFINRDIESLAKMFAGEEILGELPRGALLNSDTLDYSLESLKEVDKYLEVIRDEQTEDADAAKIILRAGAYVGEVIRRNSSIKIHWVSFEEASKFSPAVQQIGDQLATSAILWLEDNSVFFPLAKVAKHLQNGSEDSTHFFATQVINQILPQ